MNQTTNDKVIEFLLEEIRQLRGQIRDLLAYNADRSSRVEVRAPSKVADSDHTPRS